MSISFTKYCKNKIGQSNATIPKQIKTIKNICLKVWISAGATLAQVLDILAEFTPYLHTIYSPKSIYQWQEKCCSSKQI